MSDILWFAFAYLVPTLTAVFVMSRTDSLLRIVGAWLIAVTFVIVCPMLIYSMGA